MIVKTAGAELCATHQHKKPSPSDCVRAYDETYKGRVDLSKKVVIGEPVQKSSLHWSVPYDVSDAAGNKAATVWRDVIVEEVELEDVSSKMRREFEKEKEAAIRKAVDAALVEERSKTSSRTSRQQKCPDCPKCICPDNGGGLDESACNAICESRKQSCAVDEHSWIIRIMLWLESFLPTPLVPVVLAVFGTFGALLFARFIVSFFVEQRSYQPLYDTNPEHLQSHVTNHSLALVHRPETGSATTGNFGGSPGYSSSRGVAFGSPPPSSGATFGGMNGSGPPRSSMSLGIRQANSGGLFSPMQAGAQSYTSTPAAARASAITDIYENSPLISPDRRGDGVRRRSPFSR